MRLRNSVTGYGLIARCLHWLVAALIVYQYVLAERAEAATLFQRLGILGTHKSVGITILLLTLLRLVWRLTGTRPAAPPGEPALRRMLAGLSHALLYALTFALPLSGWLMSSAANTPVSYFGLLSLPDLVAPSETWQERLAVVHIGLFWSLASLVAIHAAAALYHHFVLRDDVLRRMTFAIGGPR